MRRHNALVALLILAPASLAAGTAGAQKPKPKPKPPYTIPGPISIGATPNPTVFSTPVTISGRVNKDGNGVRVTLFGRTVPSTQYVAIASATTTNNGGYTFVHRPPRNTTYRVTANVTPPVSSAELLVRVATLVGLRVSDTTPRRGSTVRFFGIVRPRHNGRRALVQKKSPTGRWVTLARPTLRTLDSRSSRYSVRLRVRRSGEYRVRVLGHSDHSTGTSRVRTLRVH